MKILRSSRASILDVARNIRPVVIVILCLSASFIASAQSARSEVPTSNGSRRDRLSFGFFFTASAHQAAFPVRAMGGDVDVIVIDLQSGGRKKLSSKGSKLLSPFLSMDGERLLLVRLDNSTAEYELLSCNTTDFLCRRLISTKNSINSPTEIEPNKILYVSSPIKLTAGVQSRYPYHDLWMVEKARSPRQVTDFKFYEMNWLSVTSRSVYFSAIGPRDGQIIPKFAPLAASDSDIFKLSFDAARGAVELPTGTLTPLFLSTGRSTAASVVPDESMAALLRTENRAGGYRYDLVVVDVKTQSSRLIESTGLGFSRPALIGQTVITREIFEDRYVVGRLLSNNASIMPLVEVTDASIASTEPTEIRFVTEGR